MADPLRRRSGLVLLACGGAVAITFAGGWAIGRLLNKPGILGWVQLAGLLVVPIVSSLWIAGVLQLLLSERQRRAPQIRWKR